MLVDNHFEQKKGWLTELGERLPECEGISALHVFRKLRNSLHTNHIVNDNTAFELKINGTEFVAKKGEGATCNLRQLSLATLLKVQKNNLTETIIHKKKLTKNEQSVEKEQTSNLNTKR